MSMKIARALLVHVALAPVIFCQGFGTITGLVTDPSNAPIGQVTVRATEVATGLTRTAVSSEEGFYTLTSLRPADYALDVEQPGFGKFRQTGITLLANQSLTVNINLVLASTSEMPGSMQSTITASNLPRVSL